MTTRQPTYQRNNAGLKKMIFRLWLDTMTGQRNFGEGDQGMDAKPSQNILSVVVESYVEIN